MDVRPEAEFRDFHIRGAVNVVAGGFAPTGTFPAVVNLFAPASLYGYGTTGLLTITGGTFAPGIATFQYFHPAGLASSGGQHNLTLAPGTSGLDYDQIQVTGPVSLGGTTLVVTSAGALPIGGSYSIIDNDGADAVVGTYAGLPEGAQFTMFANTFRITYVGSSGNDSFEIRDKGFEQIAGIACAPVWECPEFNGHSFAGTGFSGGSFGYRLGIDNRRFRFSGRSATC